MHRPFSYIVFSVFWWPSKVFIAKFVGRRREAGLQRSVLIPGCVQVPFYTISSLTQKEMTSKCRLREFTRVKALSLAQGVHLEDIAQRTLAPRNITRGVKSISKDCHWKVFLPSTSRCFSPYPIPVFPLRTLAEDRKCRGITGFGDLNLRQVTLSARTVPNTVRLSVRSTEKQRKNDLWDDFSCERIQDICDASRAEISRDFLGQGIHAQMVTMLQFYRLQYPVHITTTFMYSVIIEGRAADVNEHINWQQRYIVTYCGRI